MSVVLALYPNTRGLGYACLDMPERLLDFGVITVRPACNAIVMRRIRRFVDYYQPEILLVRDVAPSNPRVCRLVSEIEEHAKAEGLSVERLSRHQVREVFRIFNAKTKYEISRQILEWFPELEGHAPKVRKSYMDEDYTMGIFDALALASAHKYLGE
ncbi:MAG: hypothetical protein JST76_12220 [Bacteroidetes bacterium]|nr:hypothetical protein [Bacteroidota bacterium]